MLAAMLKVQASELVLAAQERAADTPGNHMVEPRLPFRNYMTAWVGHADRMAGGRQPVDQKSPRPTAGNLRNLTVPVLVDPTNPDFIQEAHLGFHSATHSGEDVPVYAIGPGAQVLYGVIEQSVIFHAMLQANATLHAITRDLMGERGVPEWRAVNKSRTSD